MRRKGFLPAGMIMTVTMVMTVTMLTACQAVSSRTSASDPASEPDREVKSEQEVEPAPVNGAGNPSQASEVGGRLTLTLANNLKEDVCTSQALEWFADRVEQESGGRIRIDVYHDGELGDSITCLEQMQYGGIDMVKADLSVLANFVPDYNAFVMPYIYRNQEHFWAVQGGEIGMEVLRGEKMRDQQMYGLTYYDAGARCFYNSRREIHSPEDMKGLRLRVQQSRLMMSMAESLGAQPVAMDYADVYPELEAGSISAAENSIVNYLEEDFYQVAPYFLNDCHTRSADILVMSQVTREKLSDEDLEMIDRAALESWEYQKTLWAESEERARQILEHENVVITEPTGEEMERFRAACEPVWYTYDNGAYNDLLDRIVAVGRNLEYQEQQEYQKKQEYQEQQEVSH